MVKAALRPVRGRSGEWVLSVHGHEQFRRPLGDGSAHLLDLLAEPGGKRQCWGTAGWTLAALVAAVLVTYLFGGFEPAMIAAK